MLKVSDLVKMPGKKDTNCSGHEDNICDCDFGWCEGYNQALDQLKRLNPTVKFVEEKEK